MSSIQYKISILLLLISSCALSQKVLSKSEKHQVIQHVKEFIDSQYILVQKIKFINSSLDSLKSSSKYQNIKDHKTFAEELSKDLVSISKDKHFKIQYNPALAKSRLESIREEAVEHEETEEQEDRFNINYWYAQKTNFGFKKVEILEGNVGYVKLTFFDVLPWVQSTIDGTMAFLTHTDALIIDIRGNGGGYVSSSYLGSYFFDEHPVIWNIAYNRPSAQRDTTYTYREVGGQRYLNKPVFILVDENSFSGAEEFAYSMIHLGKATIVGQTTAGASHSIDFLALDENFLIQLPTSSSINPVTQTDWEGVGVIPHIKTHKENALQMAYKKILEILIADTSDKELGVPSKRRKEKLQKIKAKIQNPE